MSQDKNLKLTAKGSIKGDIEASIEGDRKAVKEFFSDIVPGFAKDGIGILSDQVKYWRFCNQVDLVKRVNNKIIASKLSKNQIPLKVLAPIIEYSSLEEDESIKGKWANMLANAVTGQVDVSPNYPAILNELSPLEVSILGQIYLEANKQADYKTRKRLQFNKIAVMKHFSFTEEKADLIIENMFRLNLLKSPAGEGVRVGPIPFALSTIDIFEFTTLGFEFVRACTWKK